MITATLWNKVDEGPKSVLFVGLDRSNTDRLHNDEPIWLKLSEMDPRLPDVAVLIIAGETDEEVQEELHRIVEDSHVGQ